MYRETKKHFNPPAVPQPFWIEFTGTSYCDYTYRIIRPIERSNVFVIEYILSGEGTIEINGTEYSPCTGDFYLLQPGIPHEYYSSSHNPWNKIFANVYGPLCRSVVDLYGLTNTVLIKSCDIRRPLQEFIDIANSSDFPESQIMIRCAAKFVEVIAEAAAAKNRENSLCTSSEANYLRDYINANTHRILSINELAEIIYRSQDYTIKLFKSSFGVTPYHYQLLQKIDICKRRLYSSDDTITEIAYDLGYTDPQHFSKLFKNKCGISPKQYREMSRQK